MGNRTAQSSAAVAGAGTAPGNGSNTGGAAGERAFGAERFDAGYRRAAGDLLASLVMITERYLREQTDLNPEPRRVIYRFVEHLEREIVHLAPGSDQFEDGAGI